MSEMLKIGAIVDGDGKSPADEAIIYMNDNDDWKEITVEGRDAPELAAVIVRAVNNHEMLIEALRPFAFYFDLNDCDERDDDDALEIPIVDLRRARDLIRAIVGSPTERGK